MTRAISRDEYLRLHERLGAASTAERIEALHRTLDEAERAWSPPPQAPSTESPGTQLARWNELLDALRTWRSRHLHALLAKEIELLARLDDLFEKMPEDLQPEALTLLWRGDPEEHLRKTRLEPEGRLR